jgi:hypothetical protein
MKRRIKKEQNNEEKFDVCIDLSFGGCESGVDSHYHDQHRALRQEEQ